MDHKRRTYTWLSLGVRCGNARRVNLSKISTQDRTGQDLYSMDISQPAQMAKQALTFTRKIEG